ncbi:signal protein [Kitasatospora sp. NPDC097691]|uniref:signal protein n=1 Tax=Kitasatospora sp. NPDC097691 TaxID=3157231 RepID=UPI0033290535
MLSRRLAGVLVGALALTAACTGSPAPDRAARPATSGPAGSVPAASGSATSGTPSSGPTSSGATAEAPSPSAPATQEPPPDANPAYTARVQAILPYDVQASWWSWAASIEQARNPVLDRDGHLCGQGQKADLWFLAGTTGGAVTRSCTVPADMPVIFPVVNLSGGRTDCLDFMTAAQGSATLDGRALSVETIEPTLIRFDTVKGNPFTNGSGEVYRYACGLWVRLEPLTPGRHELSVRGSAGGFATAADYHLQVGRSAPTGAS